MYNEFYFTFDRNLSGNQLNGPVPDSLCKNIAGLYIFRFDYIPVHFPQLILSKWWEYCLCDL